MSSPAESFDRVRRAGTAAPNFDLDNDDIIKRLTQWQSLCSFNVVKAEGDAIDLEFATLPADMDAFARELYDFCPDLVDQGTGCIGEMFDAMDEDDIPPNMKELVAGVDLSSDDAGVELLKRQVERERKLQLWWD